jgi:hypothetical protein
VRRISIEQILPGMVLAKGAKNHHGQMLLGEGTTLEERHMRIFQSWGVTEVEIVDDKGGSAVKDVEIPTAIFEKAKADEDLRFGLSGRGHPAMNELFNIALARTAKRLWRESNAV